MIARTLDWLVQQGYSLADLEPLTASQLRLFVKTANERVRQQNAMTAAIRAGRRR